jgi:hypothetical protein
MRRIFCAKSLPGNRHDIAHLGLKHPIWRPIGNPRVGLDFTGTRHPFAYNGRLDFTGSFLDSTGIASVGHLHEIK